MRRHRFVTSWVYDIPGPTAGALSHVVGGWQVTGIYQWQSGKPYTIVSGVDNAGWGLGVESNRAIQNRSASRAAGRLRPDRVVQRGGVRGQSDRFVRRDIAGRVFWSELLDR